MPVGGLGLPGANPRAPPSQGRRPDALRASYGGDDPYGAPQGYRDPQMASGGGGGYDPAQSLGMPKQSEMGGSARGPVRQVPLRVEKVADKSLQSRLIYSNL